jgi:hypothetical protein
VEAPADDGVVIRVSQAARVPLVVLGCLAGAAASLALEAAARLLGA